MEGNDLTNAIPHILHILHISGFNWLKNHWCKNIIDLKLKINSDR